MKLKDTRRFHVVVNVACFLIVLVVAAVILLKPIEAVKRGFFCDDDSIRFPYRGDTISVTLLIVTSFVPALLLVLTMETTYGIISGKISPAKDTTSTEKSRKEHTKKGLMRAGLVIATLFYGNCLCYILTEIFKLSFGTLRPSFLSACQPETDVTSFANCSGLFIQDIVCRNTDDKMMIDMRKSFLSGHASFAVFNMGFIILYLQKRLPSSTPRLLVSLLQSVAAGYAVFVCATRIYDHYHHPADVLAGSVLGVIICVVTVYKICPGFMLHTPRTQLDLLPMQVPKTPAGPQDGPIQKK